MSTGYTAAILEGADFKTFALTCARAFGACITLRDEPGGAERIPDEFKPSDYCVLQAKAFGDALRKVEDMTPEECEAAAEQAWIQAETSRAQRLAKVADERRAYEAMRAQVRDWKPPTAEHVELHKFMLEQIDSSMRWDCDSSWDSQPSPRLSGAEWQAAERARLARQVAYFSAEHEKEVRRASERTQWVRALRDSLPA